MIMEERLKSHYKSLTRAIGFTRSTDAKAAPLLGLQIALAGTFAARLEKMHAILIAGQCDLETIALYVVISLYAICSVAAVGLAAWVYIPVNPKTGKSLIYFEDISSMSYESFETQAKGVNNVIIENQLLDQIHRVSQIASAKMRKVRWAFVLTGPSGVLWIVLMVWGSIQSQTI